jgi:hypothetical protein
MGEVEVTLAVYAVLRARHHLDVGLAQRLALLLVGVLGCLARGDCKILIVGGAEKRDAVAVVRPRGLRHALGQLGQLQRLAAFHRQHEELRRLRLAVFLSRTQEREMPAVRRPARRRIAFCRRKPVRLARFRPYLPQRSLVVGTFLIDGHADVRRRFAVGPQLRIADPLELEQVLFRDCPRFREHRGCRHQRATQRRKSR